jgi:hypothetical protein
MSISSVGAADCTDRATDSDTEYAGDVDVWCTANPVPIPNPTPSGAPISSPAASPSPVAIPSPSSVPTPIVGAFPVTYFAPGFSGPATRQFTQQFIAQIGNYVEVTYPAGSSSPSSGSPGGAQARMSLTGGPIDDGTLTYSVRFPVGFQFVKGGKLPGLCGGACYTGGTNGLAGWSARFMWRTAGAGEAYVYSATTIGYGDSLGRGNWYWPADGQWHSVSQHVHLNTPGVADGTIDVSIDGVHVSHDAGIEFRIDATVHIDSLMFSTFYGGHDSTWAPTADQHIDFASFTIAH